MCTLLHLEMVTGCNHLVMVLDCIHLVTKKHIQNLICYWNYLLVLVQDIRAMVLGDMNQMVMVLDSEKELLTRNLESVVCKQVTQHHLDNHLLGMMVFLEYLDDRILQIRLLAYLELAIKIIKCSR